MPMPASWNCFVCHCLRLTQLALGKSFSLAPVFPVERLERQLLRRLRQEDRFEIKSSKPAWTTWRTPVLKRKQTDLSSQPLRNWRRREAPGVLRPASETQRVRGPLRLCERARLRRKQNDRTTITDITVKGTRRLAYEKALSLKRVGLSTVA